jgi:hypothetical protein
VDTSVNGNVARRLWKERLQETHLTGITTFSDSPSSSGEELLLSELDTIDLHHGTHSANPAYTVLEVLGTSLNERIKAKLSRYGFDEFHPDSTGFRAVRPAPSD